MTAALAVSTSAALAGILAARVGGSGWLGFPLAVVLAVPWIAAATRALPAADAAFAALLVIAQLAASILPWTWLTVERARDALALAALVAATLLAAAFLGVSLGPDAGAAAREAWALLLLLALTEPATVAIRWLFALLGRTGGDAASGPPARRARLGEGEVIGILERWLIFVLVVEREFDAIAFVFAAKALARHSKLADERFAEYFLIGTLSSAALAIAAGELFHRVAS
ncbi:MAG: hypothetical protein DCC71_15145 [Proteobacteria bacterium]|nr:MAG: hypothetical protein DCC71_15145 [Pseudomonadota bacterium]